MATPASHSLGGEATIRTVRTLLIRPGAIGDSILGFPALEHLCSADTEVWVRSEIVPLVRFAGRVRSIAATGLDMLEIDPPPAVLDQLSSFDVIHSWYGAHRPAFRQAVAGLPFVFHTALPPETGDLHAADFFARQVGLATPVVPHIPVAAEPHGRVVIHPFSGGARKNWPLERWQALGAILGAERADSRFERLDDLAAWLAGAKLFVGNDSGITHLAAAVGTPVVALFGPTDPAVWAPRGPRVRILRHQPIAALRLRDVLEAVEDLGSQPALQVGVGGSPRGHQ